MSEPQCFKTNNFNLEPTSAKKKMSSDRKFSLSTEMNECTHHKSMPILVPNDKRRTSVFFWTANQTVNWINKSSRIKASYEKSCYFRDF